MVPKFHGQIKKSKFVVDEFQEKQREAYFLGLNNERVEEIVQKPSKSKTLQQLRYIHGVVFRLASEASGYTVQEIKGLLKGYFLTEYIKGPDGKEIPFVKSLADLKVSEMAEFIDNCISLIAQHWHCVIPPPEQVGY